MHPPLSIVDPAKELEQAISSLSNQRLISALLAPNLRGKLKRVHKFLESTDQSTAKNELIKSIKQPLIAEYLFGSAQAKPFLNGIIRKCKPITLGLFCHIVAQRIQSYQQCLLAADVLEICEPLQNAPSNDEAAILRQIVGLLTNNFGEIINECLAKLSTVRLYQRFLQNLKALGSAFRIFHGEESMKQWKYLVLSGLRKLPQDLMGGYVRDVLSQIYFLMVLLDDNTPSPKTIICRIHYWNAYSVIRNVNCLGKLRELLQQIRETQHKFHITPVLNKAFSEYFDQEPNKDVWFDLLMPLHEAGRSLYGALQDMIDKIILSGAKWNLQGALQRKFFIGKVALDHVNSQAVLSQWPTMLSDVIRSAGSMAVPYAYECASALLSKLYEECGGDFDRWSQSWYPVYKQCLLSNTRQEVRGVIQFVNPVLLKIDVRPRVLQLLLKERATNPHHHLDYSIVSLLKCAKNASKVVFSVGCFSHIDDPEHKYPLGHLEDLLLSGDEATRIEALEFLTQDSKNSEPLNPAIYPLLETFISYSLKTSHPQYRRNYLNCLRKLFERLRIFYNSELTKTAKKPKPFMTEFTIFMKKTVSNCFQYVFPDSPFESITPAIEILTLILAYFSPDHSKVKRTLAFEPTNFLIQQASFFDEKHFWNLVSALESSFQAVRTSAFELLEGYSRQIKHINLNGVWEQAINNLTRLTMRSYEAASRLLTLLGCIYQIPISGGKSAIPQVNVLEFLCNLLKQRYIVFKGEFVTQSDKCAEYSLHGVLTTIAFTLQSLAKKAALNILAEKEETEKIKLILSALFQELRSVLAFAVEVSSSAISTVVLDKLPSQTDTKLKVDCRGHFVGISSLLDSTTMTANMQNEEEGVENELVVIFYLMTREAGLVLQSIATLLASPAVTLVPVGGLKQLISGFFFAMVNLRHMGSVDRISVGMKKLSGTLHLCNDTTLIKLPSELVSQLITLLESGSFTNILRRSAGVPYAFSCLLKNQFPERKLCIERTTQVLIRMSSQGAQQLQIHALNILKKLFQDADLRAELDSYVSKAFIAAIEGFTSQSWGVRNSSLILFSGLASRTVGLKPTYNLMEFFRKCPELFDYFRTRVGHLASNTMYPPLYPIALLLSRLLPFEVHEKGLETGEMNKDTLLQLLPYIRTAGLANMNHMGRVITAKATLPFLNFQHILPYIAEQLSKLTEEYSKKSNNQIHSTLSECFHLLDAFVDLNSNASTSRFEFSANTAMEPLILSLHKAICLFEGVKCNPNLEELIKIYQCTLSRLKPALEHSLPLCKTLTVVLPPLLKSTPTLHGFKCDVGHTRMRCSCIKLTWLCHSIIGDEHSCAMMLVTQVLSNRGSIRPNATILQQCLPILTQYSKSKKSSPAELKEFALSLPIHSTTNNTLLCATLELRHEIPSIRIKADEVPVLLQMQVNTTNHELQIAIFKALWRAELQPRQQLISLLHKYSDPEQLSQLRGLCVQFLQEQKQIDSSLNLVYLRLLEDEEPLLRKGTAQAFSKAVEKGKKVSQCVDQVKSYLLGQLFKLPDLEALLASNSDFVVKKSNYEEKRIFSFDKPNKYRADIITLIVALTRNKAISSRKEEVKSIIQKYTLLTASQVEQIASQFVANPLNRTEYSFEVVTRALVLGLCPPDLQMKIGAQHSLLEELRVLYC